MKREIWKLNLKTCRKNLWKQSEQYSQRSLNNLCSCVTEPIGWRQYFCLSPSKWVSLWGKCNPYPPPEEYCSALDTRQSFSFAASVVACVTGAKSGGRKAPFFPFSLSPTPFDACYGSQRNFACVKTPLFKSFQTWPNMGASFTTENNTYCFRIGPVFLDTGKMLKARKHEKFPTDFV